MGGPDGRGSTFSGVDFLHGASACRSWAASREEQGSAELSWSRPWKAPEDRLGQAHV